MNRKDQVISNLTWRFLERCGAQMVSFIVSIVLARYSDAGAIWAGSIDYSVYFHIECICRQWIWKCTDSEKRCR